MKQFDDNFKLKLGKTIKEIEDASLAEVVVVIKSQSEQYKDVSFRFAAVFTFLVFSFLMFSHFEFDVYLIYFITVLSFVFSYFATELIKPLKRLFVSKKRMKKNVEIYGRAIFQKGGIRFTAEKIGVLFYVSIFEKEVYILPDRGAFTLVPHEEWDKMKTSFNNIFKEKDIAEAFLSELKKCKNVFAEYILPAENDINELPDDLDVEF